MCVCVCVTEQNGPRQYPSISVYGENGISLIPSEKQCFYNHISVLQRAPRDHTKKIDLLSSRQYSKEPNMGWKNSWCFISTCKNIHNLIHMLKTVTVPYVENTSSTQQSLFTSNLPTAFCGNVQTTKQRKALKYNRLGFDDFSL